MSTYSPQIEAAKRILLQGFVDDKGIEHLCRDHSQCLRWAIQKAGQEVPKELQ